MDVGEVKHEVRGIALGLDKEEILAVGLFGSLARGDFDERSDIDIFVITEKEIPLKEQDELYYAFSELVAKFRRDITVLVYDIKGLKKIPTWQTLNLVKDAHFVYDKVEIKSIFQRILQAAREHGIAYDDQEKVFRLEKPGRVVFSLEE
mgnify:CR=1 FL=1